MDLSRQVRKLSQQLPYVAVRLGFRVAGVVTPVAVWGANRIFYRPGRRHARQGLSLPDVEELAIMVRGKRAVAYVVGTGAPVLIVHGWQTSANHLSTLARALVERGYRVITFDMPGHGKSEGEETDITEVTEIGRELSRRYGPFAAAIGHSYGGLCLSNLLREGVSAERVVLVACPATYQLLVDRLCAVLGLAGAVKGRFVAGVHRRYHPYSVERDFDAVKNLANRPVPTLLVHDRKDQSVPVGDVELLARAHPNIQVKVTSGFGHSYVMKAPEVIETCVSFLGNDSAQDGQASDMS